MAACLERLANGTRLCTVLAWHALRMARTTTGISVLLVSTSVLCVVGADRAFLRLADVVARLADGGDGATATIDIERCRGCEHAWRASPALRRHVVVHSASAIRVRRVGPLPTPGRSVPVICTPPWRTPSRVQWQTPAAKQSWFRAMPPAGVLVGASLAPPADRSAEALVLETTQGPWPVLGTLHPRPLLAHDAAENGAIVVPWRAPFLGLCNRGRRHWRVEAPDSTALRARIAQVESALRIAHGLGPGDDGAWRVSAPDRFAVLVRALVRRFSRWILAVPVVVSLLCGAGLFSVQALEGTARVHEFGVRRAVGATRAVLIGQLCVEAALVCVAGVAVGAIVLAGAGLLGTALPEVTHGLLAALLVAAPLSIVGLVIPGLAAVQAVSIAGLEGRGAS